MDKPTIYIAIEIKNREYVSQILLAAKAVLRGYRVYLGSHAAIYNLLRVKKIKAGIFLDKSTQPQSRMLWNRKYIESYCVMDVELSPVLTQEIWRREFPSRIYPNTDDLVDKFLVVGSDLSKVAIEHYGKSESKVVVSGWPRVDIWTGLGSQIYTSQVSKIEKRYGTFLLFASSFGNIRDPLETQSISAIPPIKTELSNLDAQLRNYSNFKNAIKIFQKWDKDPNMPAIVIRPHTSERKAIWKSELGSLKKTFVVQRGESNPWVLASCGVIHHCSSVALEGYLSGKNVFALLLNDEESSNHVGWAVSKYLLDCDSSIQNMNLSQITLNPDYNPDLLKNLIHTPANGATSSVIDLFDKLNTKFETNHRVMKILLSHVNGNSIRRTFGLVRDEIYWKFGKTNINPQAHFIPWGLDRKKIKMVLKSDAKFRNVRYRRMTVNLWEFDER